MFPRKYNDLIDKYSQEYNLDKYLMYFIKEGTAELTTRDGETITLGNGFFVNFPNNGFCYKCDDSSPWSIKWISVNGDIIEKSIYE